jgi:CRISPR-associated endonuclease/helicase Cas3
LAKNRDRNKEKPFILVTTQTIEVGADFDFDSIVSQAAPLDCLIQRFGRQDRLGTLGKSNGVVVFKDDGKKDKIYGTKAKDTFAWLEEKYGKTLDINKVDIDHTLYAETLYIATLTDELLGLLPLTSQSSMMSLDGLLHGVKTKPDADFQMVYRNEITEELLKSENAEYKVKQWLGSRESFKFVHPKNHEILSVPIYSLYTKDASDTEITGDDDEASLRAAEKEEWELLNRKCVRYRDGKIISMSEIITGDLVIVPTTYGQYDEFGWNPDSNEPVKDVSDESPNTIRLHPLSLPGFYLNRYRDSDKLVDYDSLFESLNKEEWAANLSQDKIKIIKTGGRKITPDQKGIYFYKKDKKDQKRQRLDEHNTKVGDKAALFAKTVGLEKDLVDLLGTAGNCHDLGKADPRFQKMLAFPNKANPNLYLAKSEGWNPKAPKMPVLWRHELQSLQIVIENNIGQNLTDLELFYHVIAAHHGWCRNRMPVSFDFGFEEFNYGKLQSSKSYQESNLGYDFNDLNQKYGYWGLAYLETILRLADWEGSK